METEGFERAVLEHKDRVHSYAIGLLRDPVEAQDVAQEALVRLWQNRERVEQQGARAWLLRSAHNLCIDRIRRRRSRREVGLDGFDGRAASPGPQKLAESGELGRLIHGALQELSPRDRAVVLLREVQGLAYEEIASVLDVPLGTVKAQLHRARERLRGRLVRSGVSP